MITTVKLITYPSPHIVSLHVCVCVLVCVLTGKPNSLSKSQQHSTESLTIITRLYIRSTKLTHFITESLYPLTNISSLSPPPILTTTV